MTAFFSHAIKIHWALLVCVALANIGCTASSPVRTTDQKPFLFYQERANAASATRVLDDDYTYAGVSLLSTVPTSAGLLPQKTADGLLRYQIDDIDAPFDRAIVDVLEGHIVALTLMTEFPDEAAARRFFNAAYISMARKYSKLISPVTDGDAGSLSRITIAYWSFSTSEDWIDHMATMNASRAEMAWLYQGKEYLPSSAISEVLSRVSIGFHTPAETKSSSFYVVVSYNTHVERQFKREARYDLIESLDL